MFRGARNAVTSWLDWGSDHRVLHRANSGGSPGRSTRGRAWSSRLHGSRFWLYSFDESPATPPLDCGQAAAASAAWLDVSTGALDVLIQRYERRSETTYWYEAPRFTSAECLEVDHVG